MEELQLTLLFIISAALGGLIGVQVERNTHRVFIPGIRTHIIVAVLGALSIILYQQLELKYLVYAIFASIILFIMHENEVKKNSKRKYQNSFLYEILIIVSFVNGILVASESLYIAVFITFLISILLYTTPNLHKLAVKISKEEIQSALIFICISAVILPLLPNSSISLSSISLFQEFLPQTLLNALNSANGLNPFLIWSLVVIISALSFCSYILMKILGERKGLFVTSLLGGIVSSTALSTSYSISSQKNKALLQLYAGGIVLASSIMFIRILFEIAILSPKLAAIMAFPLLFTTIVGVGIVYFAFSKNIKQFKQHPELKSPFRVVPALIFGALFTIIILLSSLSLHFFSNVGLYITALLSGLVDADAITLSATQMFKTQVIPVNIAIITISIGLISNTFVKVLITYFLGSKELFKLVFKFFCILIATFTLSTTAVYLMVL